MARLCAAPNRHQARRQHRRERTPLGEPPCDAVEPTAQPARSREQTEGVAAKGGHQTTKTFRSLPPAKCNKQVLDMDAVKEAGDPRSPPARPRPRVAAAGTHPARSPLTPPKVSVPRRPSVQERRLATKHPARHREHADRPHIPGRFRDQRDRPSTTPEERRRQRSKPSRARRRASKSHRAGTSHQTDPAITVCSTACAFLQAASACATLPSWQIGLLLGIDATAEISVQFRADVVVWLVCVLPAVLRSEPCQSH